MRTVLLVLTILIFATITGGAFSVTEAKDSKHIVLIGASIGSGWDLPNLAHRISRTDYSFEYVGSDGFDKEAYLEKILKRKDKPYAVIIKECAAYFPGDIEGYKKEVILWINQLRSAKIIPILATVVPVTRPNYFTMSYAKDFLKIHFLRDKINMEARLPDILKYNDWVRTYSKENDIAVLDLESALRVSSTDRRLRQDLTSGDGLHINSDAYRLLDKLMIQTIGSIK